MKNYYIWAAVERIAPQFVTFGISIVVARLLGPEAYGLIGMLTIFIALGQAFSELGLTAAIIQRKEVSDVDLTSVFYVNIVAGALITTLCCAISPLAADFYGKPLLQPLLCAQSVTFLISSLGTVQVALVSREMRFQMSAKVELIACVGSGLAGLSMAILGLGVWSLVGLNLSRIMLRVLLLWLLAGWRPRGKFSKTAFLPMWEYSSRLLYASLFHRVATNAYSVIVGKMFSPAVLGLYSRAVGLQEMPVGIIAGIVQRVAFPLYSRNQENQLYLHKILRKQVRLVLGVVVPGMAILFAISDELIFVCWGMIGAGISVVEDIVFRRGLFEHCTSAC